MWEMIKNIIHMGPLDGKKKGIGILLYLLTLKWPDFPVDALNPLLENGAVLMMTWGLISDAVHAIGNYFKGR